MKLSRVYARFYKSFNFDNVRKVAGSQARGEWEMIGDRYYPFVEIPLDKRITAVVGANESGKSHLLGAIRRGITGEEWSELDLCRYCDFFGVEAGEQRWPHIGLDWSDLTDAESERLAEILKRGDERPKSFLMFRYGPHETHVWLSAAGPRIDLNDDQVEALTEILPKPLTIDPEIALPGSVPIRLLANANEASPILSDRRERSILLEAARQIVGLVTNAPESVTNNASSIHNALLPLTLKSQPTSLPEEVEKQMALTRSLLFDMANIDKDTFRLLARSVAKSQDGYANAVTEKLNEQIERSLNLRRWWVQDRDFSLRVSTREHEIVFTIRDRTGTEYTFNERSSGLKYFLSYLIQSQAGRAAGGNRILLMDEPDAHLSAEAQQDLLRIFADLAEPLTHEQPPIQVVYVTHSPFLLDKNHADRIRVLEKGRGLDGTRVIPGAAHNHYEPLRSAFGAFVGETAFVGAVNLLVEGAADQILLAGAARAVRTDGVSSTEETLDLNRLVIVPCGSAGQVVYMTQVIRGRGDVERPPVLALLDSDAQGRDAAGLLLKDRKLKKLIEARFVLEMEKLRLAGARKIEELEDIVPPVLAIEAANRALAEVFRFRDGQAPILSVNDLSKAESTPLFDRLEAALKAKRQGLGKVTFAKALIAVIEAPALNPELTKARSVFLGSMKKLFRLINTAQREAELQSRKVKNASLVTDRVKIFTMDNPNNATRESVDQLLIMIDRQMDDSNEADIIRARMSEIRTDHRLRDDLMASVADYPKLLEDLIALKDAAKIQRELAQARLKKASTKPKSKDKAGPDGATAAKAPAQAKSSKPTPAAEAAPDAPGQPTSPADDGE